MDSAGYVTESACARPSFAGRQELSFRIQKQRLEQNKALCHHGFAGRLPRQTDGLLLI